MKRLLVLFAAVLAVALAGCGSAKLQQDANNHQVTSDEATAQKIVQGCVSHGNFLTKGGRKRIELCILPSGQSAKFQACVEHGLGGVGIITSAVDRGKLYTALNNCAVKYR